jgi:hypothetical protein
MTWDILENLWVDTFGCILPAFRGASETPEQACGFRDSDETDPFERETTPSSVPLGRTFSQVVLKLHCGQIFRSGWLLPPAPSFHE